LSRAARNDVKIFEDDCNEHGGYRYSTDARLSSDLANQRLSSLVQELANFKNKRVLDLGCGDGTYSQQLLAIAGAGSVHGIDPAQAAIEVAKRCCHQQELSFECVSGDNLPFSDNSFDIVHIRGVLHHMKDPAQALKEAFRVGKSVVIIEPNGYSPILKIIEKVSPYHRQHNEKSYTAHTLRGWIRAAGGQVEQEAFGGLVPMFCPDIMAKFAKKLEGAVEMTPLLNRLCLAVYGCRAEKIVC